MSLTALWRERSRLSPFSLACVWDDLSLLPVLWTYSQLAETSASVSCILRTRLKPSTKGRPFVIGLYAFNSPNTLAAILSVLALPAGYSPIRPGPSERVWSQVQESGMSVILVQMNLIQEFINQQEAWLIKDNWRASTLLLEYDFVVFGTVRGWISYPETYSRTTCIGTRMCPNCTEALPSFVESNKLPDLNIMPTYDVTRHHLDSYPTGLSYLVYTTGTTGSPKGVWVPHCCIVPNVLDLSKRFGVREDDRVFNASPLTFDPSVVEIFMTLSSGAALLLVPPSIKSSPLLFTHIVLRARHVTILQATPSLIRQLPSEVLREELLGAWSSLRLLAFGGEACPSIKTISEWKCDQNETRLFNIYGITEVSSWASCYEIKLSFAHNEDPLSEPVDESCTFGVPIGEPLLGTQIELRGGESKRVFIGGAYRVCCLGNERALVPGTFRDSGDEGKVDEEGQIYLCGRSDRQVKRRGHRINLDYVEQVILSLSLVHQCCVIERPPGTGVVAVVVPTVVMATSRIKELLFEEMRSCLRDEEIPDQVEIVQELPVNNHGKIDVKAISSSSLSSPPLTLQRWRELVLESVTMATGIVAMTMRKNEDTKLSEIGITSFQLLRTVYQLEEYLVNFNEDKKDSVLSRIFDLLLNRPLDEAIVTTFRLVTSSEEEGGDGSGYHGNQDSGHKRALSEDGLTLDSSLKRHCTRSKDLKWYRRGLVYDNDERFVLWLRIPAVPCDVLSWKLVTEWVVPTGGCVDSSPLVVRSRGNDVAYVGSHSGLVLCTELRGGVIKWWTQLRGRVESSPCVSNCGEYIIIGCYDGCLYSLCSSTGGIHWCFATKGSSTQEPIKSSPLPHPRTGFIWFGSHDQHLYAVDIHERQCIHAIHLGGGACFSSVTFSRDFSKAIIATLHGKILCIETDIGTVLWEYSCPRPVFATPTLLPNDDIICGCVNGSLFIVSSHGNFVTELMTEGPIFTSCVVAMATTMLGSFFIFCGSHDRHMYCWESGRGLENGQYMYDLKWKRALNGEIYSTGMLGHMIDHVTNILCTCTADGTIYIISPECGRVLTSRPLSGQIFSSPVFIDGHVIVGCRDDGLHSLLLVKERENEV